MRIVFAKIRDWLNAPSPARDERGFTLMELLVVMALFSTIVLIASDIFLISSRTQRKIYGSERVQADARFTMEAIVREVRTGEIDYAYYASRNTTGITTPEPELALRQSDDTAIRFKVSDSSTNSYCANALSSPCLLVTIGNGTPQSITPKNVVVRTANFYVAPSTDPNVLNTTTGAYSSNVQPRVTAVLVLESRGTATQEQTTVYLQTTAASRIYSR